MGRDHSRYCEISGCGRCSGVANSERSAIFVADEARTTKRGDVGEGTTRPAHRAPPAPEAAQRGLTNTPIPSLHSPLAPDTAS